MISNGCYLERRWKLAAYRSLQRAMAVGGPLETGRKHSSFLDDAGNPYSLRAREAILIPLHPARQHNFAMQVVYFLF